MSKWDIPKDIQQILDSIKNKRAKVVINHIIEHGQITTEELEKDYGYKHPPRAARDVREAGIPLITTKTKSKDGSRTIAAYTFGDFSKIKLDRIKGRIDWPKNFKQKLVKKYGQQCLLSQAKLSTRALQIDHRIPYELVGDNPQQKLKVEDFMLLSSSSNRAKSWSCEHCDNLLNIQNPKLCTSCYWAYPEQYDHIALQAIRQLELTWQGEEIEEYKQLKAASEQAEIELSTYIKMLLKKSLE